MRFRVVVMLALLAAGMMVFAPSNALARTTPKCKGKAATIVVVAGSGDVHGTPENDVIVGSPANDVIYGEGGFDIVCGNGGDDQISVHGPGSWADGGSGYDTVSAQSGATGIGGSGGDSLTTDGGFVDGGSGNDELFVTAGGSGDGGSGGDLVVGEDAVKLLGGSGEDYVVEEGNTPLVDCGSNADSFDTDGGAEIRRCENFEQYDTCGCLITPNLNMLAARLDRAA